MSANNDFIKYGSAVLFLTDTGEDGRAGSHGFARATPSTDARPGDGDCAGQNGVTAQEFSDGRVDLTRRFPLGVFTRWPVAVGEHLPA